ncbi:AraC family transcriptional regulator [Aliidiomarina taiwanensis]|uniref:AraC family transcriptional regulator n=2 Tax=Aliidiomarina taiwanensis TaxID=946228 RepID=A0A432XAQ5_9GAMM|nr:AraC family transcriptional regulator [Aliidiomarina taiwanensis]
MSKPSNWPLPEGSTRLIMPQPLLEQLQQNPLTRGLYPISYGHYLNAYGHRVRRRVHTDYLMIFCHAGRGRYRAGKHKGHLLPGQVLFLKKGVAHIYQADSQQPWSIYWAHFAGDQVESFMDYLGISATSSEPAHPHGNPVLTLQNWRALLSDVTQLLNLQHERLNFDKGVLAAALLRKLLSELPLMARPKQADRKEFNLSSLQRFMRDNSHKSLELNELAEFTGLSRYHFSKKFRQTTGDSPVNYFTRMKMEQAAQMLREGEQTIRQISQTLGYDDPYYFSRLFKKHQGLAPSFYRQHAG